MKVLRPKIDIFGLQCVLNVEYNWPLNQKQAEFREMQVGCQIHIFIIFAPIFSPWLRFSIQIFV